MVKINKNQKKKMIINLQDLANKRAKPAQGLTISDHRLNLSKFTGSELVITGSGTKGMAIEGARGIEVTFRDAVIDNSSTGVTIKFDGRTSNIKVNGTGSKIFAKAGNAASQVIYFLGVHDNIEIFGFEIDQRRDNRLGSSAAGACLQFAGVPKSSLESVGKIWQHDMVLMNTGDEGIYSGHFKPVSDAGVAMASGEELVVERVKVLNAGRDFIQQQGFKKVRISECYGDNGGIEGNKDHCSALSMNGGTQELIVENCEFKNVSQLMYSGTNGTTIKALIDNVKFYQGTHAGVRANSGAYLKGPGSYTFKNCILDAPNSLKGVISAEGCTVNWDVSNTFNGVEDFVKYPGSIFKELPLITKGHIETVEERTSTGSKLWAVMPDGTRVLLK